MALSITKKRDHRDRRGIARYHHDRCYKTQGFQRDSDLVERLFQLYEQLVAPLGVTEKPKKPRKKS